VKLRKWKAEVPEPNHGTQLGWWGQPVPRERPQSAQSTAQVSHAKLPLAWAGGVRPRSCPAHSTHNTDWGLFSSGPSKRCLVVC
jgi:hypothetical protein